MSEESGELELTVAESAAASTSDSVLVRVVGKDEPRFHHLIFYDDISYDEDFLGYYHMQATIGNSAGSLLHMRPLGQIVQDLNGYPGEVYVNLSGSDGFVNGKSIMGLLQHLLVPGHVGATVNLFYEPVDMEKARAVHAQVQHDFRNYEGA